MSLKGRLDREVGNFISENSRLKYFSVQKDDAVDLENLIREGKNGRTPKLNPKSRNWHLKIGTK